MGRFDALAKFLGVAAKDIGDDAVKALEKVASPEVAVGLKGAPREQYLKALDEVYGPQAIRAKGMGFGDRTWYHGTTVPIDKFDKEALGLSTGAESAKKGFFFASDPSTASDYAELAREKGIIREGDKITTRLFSDTADLHNEAYDEIKRLAYERDWRLGSIQKQIDRNSNTQQVTESAKKRGELDRIKELETKLKNGKDFIDRMRIEADHFSKQIKSIDDNIGSQGQNVLPVRLQGDPSNIHVKNYKGQGYRDTTYADEMAKAQEQGKTGVLFKNTYDPADPSNRVKQDIAAVFEPNQIRSVNAAFDPRFKDSALLMAGGAAMPMAPNINSAFEDLKFGLGKYEELKGKLAKPLAKSLDLTGGNDPQFQAIAQGLLTTGLDPLSYLPGAAGVAAGAAQAFTPSEEEMAKMNALRKMRGY